MFVGTEAFYMMAEMADDADYSVFENKTGLAEDMKFLASMPELCVKIQYIICSILDIIYFNINLV